MKTLSRQDLTDILLGAAILGTGGGGEIDEGMGLIDHALSQGKQFNLVALDQVPDDALVCTPYMLGAVAPLSEELEPQYQSLTRIDEPPILLAYRRFQQYLGREFYGTIACELGGANTAVAFFAAAMSGHNIIDADPAGRAVPEVTHSTYYLNGLPTGPIMVANEFGECIICENLADDQRAENILRALAKVSRNDIAAIDHAFEMHAIRHAVIPGVISQALKMGQVWRMAQGNGADIAQVVADEGQGFVAFRGEIASNDQCVEGGFTIGNIEIVGRGEFASDRYRIWLKNENMIGRLNDKVHTTIPDMICLIDLDTGMPVTNPNYHTGQNVAVVILPAPEPFTSPKGLSVFGPAYLGLDIPYEPAVAKWAAGRTPN